MVEYVLIGFGVVATQLRAAEVENLTPEHYVSQGVQEAGLQTLCSEDFLGRRLATHSGCDITVNNRIFACTVGSIVDVIKAKPS